MRIPSIRSCLVVKSYSLTVYLQLGCPGFESQVRHLFLLVRTPFPIVCICWGTREREIENTTKIGLLFSIAFYQTLLHPPINKKILNKLSKKPTHNRKSNSNRISNPKKILQNKVLSYIESLAQPLRCVCWVNDGFNKCGIEWESKLKGNSQIWRERLWEYYKKNLI